MANFFTSKQTRGFLLIWFGQFLSIIGSGMTSFVLAIWSYQKSWSTGHFSTIVLAASLPGILIGPFAGALVDRWDKRRTMIAAVVGQAISTLGLAALFATNQIDSYWQIYPAIILIAVCGAFQWPALSAAWAVLVPKEYYSQSGALWQLNQAAVMILSPLLAVALMPYVKIQGIVLFDALSYTFAIVTLILVYIPPIPKDESTDTAVETGGPVLVFLRQVAQGWLYIKARPALLQLLAYSLVFNLVLDMVQIVVMPLAVKGGTPGRLAGIMAASALGMVVGSVGMAAWSGPQRRITGVLGSGVISGLALAAAGPLQNPYLVAGAFFCFTLCIPAGQTSAAAIWLSKTARDLMGRVTATTNMLTQLCFPLGCFIAPILTDRVFGPILAPQGLLAGTIVGTIYGVGEQRGVALLLTVMGGTTILAAVVAWASSTVRNIERDLPDISEPEPEPEPETLTSPDLIMTNQAAAGGENT